MQGPAQPWEQPPDPRESTVSMPRIDLSWLTDPVSGSAMAAYDGGTGLELPELGDPYARPGRDAGPLPETAAALGEPLLAGPGPAEPAEPGEPAEPAAPAEPATPSGPGHPGPASHGATEQPPGRAVRRAAPAATGQPSVGSLAELQARLEKLPDGHPSSPYDDDGWLRPAPTRLRQLELGVPGRPAGTQSGHAARFGMGAGNDSVNAGPPPATTADPATRAGPRRDELPGPAAPPPAAPAADDAPADAGPGHAETGQAAAPADTAERPVTPPAEPPFPPTGPAEPNGHNSPGGGNGRRQLKRPYPAPADGGGGGNGSRARDLTPTPWPADGAPAARGSVRSHDGNGHRPAAPAPLAKPDEPAAPSGERRGAEPGRGDSPGSADAAAPAADPLPPEHRDLVERILAACRAAEGRDKSGGYGSSGLTPALRRIAAQLPVGGLAPGSAADTLKPAGRFAARLARLIDRQPGRPPAELAATISDGIRYAFTFPAADYTEGTLLVHRKLKAHGFDLEARRNQWDSREWKGLVTRWRDPAHELPFEVQFHTTESWTMVRQTHDAYLRITDPATPAAERARLRARQAAAAATVSPPPGCLDIADFRAGTR